MYKKTILFISRAYGETGGGMERLSYELINEFKNDSSLEVKTITHQPPKGTSLKTIRLLGTLKALILIPQALKAARHADIIHLGDPVLSLIGWLIKTIYNKPIVVTVHGLDVSYNNPLYKFYLKLFFTNLDGYIPISHHAKKLLLEKLPSHSLATERGGDKGDYKLKAISYKLAVIPPGIHDRHYQPNPSRQALERLIGQTIYNKSVLVTVGRLVPRKGHAWFIEHVMPALSDDYLYLIIGSGPEKASLRRIIKNKDLQSRVLLFGRLADNDLTTVYNTADAFIQPNIPTEGDAEGFGLVLLEAALCQRLVLASNLEGIPDAIHDHQNGLLLEPQNPKVWIKTIQDQVKPETKNAKARAYTLKTFSWPEIKQQYLEFFTKIAS